MIETIPPISTDKVKWRQLQYLQPGHWVLIEYENDEGQRFLTERDGERAGLTIPESGGEAA